MVKSLRDGMELGKVWLVARSEILLGEELNMLAFANEVLHSFDSGVRSRGASYYRGGKVRITSGSDGLVTAIVRGGRDYNVSVELIENHLVASCSCPYFEGTDLCKHLWATLMTAAEVGYLRDADKVSHLQISCDGNFFESEDSVSAEDDDIDSEDDDLQPGPLQPPQFAWETRHQNSRQNIQKAPRTWQTIVGSFSGGIQLGMDGGEDLERRDREINYYLDADMILSGRGLVIGIVCRERRLDGAWGTFKPFSITGHKLVHVHDPQDLRILAVLAGAENMFRYGGYNSYGSNYSVISVPLTLEDAVLPMLCSTGRCFIRKEGHPPFGPLVFDDASPWNLELDVVRSEEKKEYIVSGVLTRGDERRSLLDPVLLMVGGWVLWPDKISRLNDDGIFPWIVILRKEKDLRVPVKQGEQFLKSVLASDCVPRMLLPAELTFEDIVGQPKPILKIKRPRDNDAGVYLASRVEFDYEGIRVASQDKQRGFFLSSPRRFVRRDLNAERRAMGRLRELKHRPRQRTWEHGYDFELHEKWLPDVVSTLVGESWLVEADGKLYRRAGKFDLSVVSGVDWFELRGQCDFEGATLELPALLSALKRGDKTVLLGDGNLGVLPAEWLKKYGALTAVGKVEGDHLRFSRCQVAVLDALLAAQPETRCDETFDRLRNELHSFDHIEPVDPPPGFEGQLRGYQKEGMGWLLFLQRFGFGGCLADDMGLGKTVQTLSLLELRRQEGCGPSLVVMPRSLIFNWMNEAAQFTPGLRVFDNTGKDRIKDVAELAEYDLILTTYGTLRRDAPHLKDFEFDYVILDEAQMIKNANTASAKAARLLCCRHRLALSGTPIENHIGELWSLFEFLNPGMLGTVAVFKSFYMKGLDVHSEEISLLTRAIRPFLLRRTKDEVAPELPKKLEETIYCELEKSERKAYNELRDHYRRSLLSRVEENGLAKSKMHVLEALLRLRQAACHPGLIDPKRKGATSAKLSTLLEQVSEVVDEGHKALVFSQFTSFLGIVRSRLDDRGVTYEYLDGKTRKREQNVRRFQEDPDCKLFLISLKAGGLGLNLTAAEYVFLLDPWWNPATEAQAIDRTHRIGQTRSVFAYRLISKDTVEEKVLELQKVKKELADAIINADNSLIRDLSREDLELLLS